MPRVAVFFDWQNAYHCARDAFCDENSPSRFGNFWPKAMAQLLAEKGPSGPPRREVTFIGIYVGAPDPRKDEHGARAQSRRVAAWQRESGALLTVKQRGLRYPVGRPISEAEEKGVDVRMSRCDGSATTTSAPSGTTRTTTAEAGGRGAPVPSHSRRSTLCPLITSANGLFHGT
jgi:hypothetical protein